MMGEWSVSQWILGVMRFQKIFGLNGVERHKEEKWSLVRRVLGGFGGSGGSVRVMSGWSVGQWIVGVISFQKMYIINVSYCGESGDVTDAGRTNNK